MLVVVVVVVVVVVEVAAVVGSRRARPFATAVGSEQQSEAMSLREPALGARCQVPGDADTHLRESAVSAQSAAPSAASARNRPTD
mmetsp:Transcript_6022/g.22055  ORF Transcript_6022/g.22055 Transcript_6022/m.22055 type:complete len:85 (-) Transcript_6022:125-379(-)